MISKSLFRVMTAYQDMIQGNQVVYIDPEMSYEDVDSRFALRHPALFRS